MGHVCITGDVHGHLQLALGVAARWQEELESDFEAILICGDIGSFARVEDADRATSRHAVDNPCELEFPLQWMRPEESPWLAGINEDTRNGGLGLKAPVILTHGNHEGFDLIRAASQQGIPDGPVAIAELRAIDPAGRLLLLPNGWRLSLPSGLIVAAVGGIQPGQRPRAGYDPMAYIDEKAVESIVAGGEIDVLITHQGPRLTQGFGRGSELFDQIADSGKVRTWFHGHSVGDPEVKTHGGTTVVPMDGLPFRPEGPMKGQPDEDSWCSLQITVNEIDIDRRRPECWWEFHQSNWSRLPDGSLVAPPLAHLR